MVAHYQQLYIDVEELEPSPWNPNKQPPEVFERLCDEMAKFGCTVPLQVVKKQGGGYRIIGGEHRWLAAKKLGMEAVPCLVLEGDAWASEDLQKFETVRLNILHGNLDPDRFLKLYEEMVDKFGQEQVQQLFAFTDAKEFQKLISRLKKDLARSIPGAKGQVKKLDAANTVEDVNRIVQEIIGRHGSTVDKGYMVFTYAHADHVYVPLDKETYALVKKLLKTVEAKNLHVSRALVPGLQEALRTAEGLLPEPVVRVTGAEFEDENS